MTRVRISTTVDAERLERARALLAMSDSRLLDRALAALLDQFEAARELAALDRQPYDEDADLTWRTAPPPPLPYDGDVPDDVLALAEARRRARPDRESEDSAG